jgi:hypothetical protein
MIVMIRWIVILLLICPAWAQAPQYSGNPPDSSAAIGSTYFTAKLENLTQKLQLSTDQQAKMKPITEQEIGYLQEIYGNPVLSKGEKLKKLKEIIRGSDTQMKSFLSSEQWKGLQDLRKEQKSELTRMFKSQHDSQR